MLDLRNQLTEMQILVVGLGASGQSILRFLTARGVSGDCVCVTDTRANPPVDEDDLPAGITVHTGALPEHLPAGYELVIVSPGVDLRQPLFESAQRQQIPVIGDIELFAHFVDAPVIAVTGSNGKSTTVTLLHAMANAAGLQAALGGNIGIPALDLLTVHAPADDALPATDVYILELSSFQLESTFSLKCAVAAVLNVSADHMDRYDSLFGYAAAKAKIFEHADAAVINADDELVRDMPLAHVDGAACFSFTQQQPNGAAYGLVREREHDSDGDQDRVWLVHRNPASNDNEKLIAADELKIAGIPNQMNVLAAVAMADVMGWSRAAVLQAAHQFGGLPHRMQWVADIAGVRYFNDSKGTNVGATLAAIQGLDESVVLIAGGQSKGGDFAPLRDVLAQQGRAVVLIGEDAQLIADALAGCLPIKFADGLIEAVQLAAELAEAGDAVVLSPACASFDMFRGFEARGEAFVAAVEQLQQIGVPESAESAGSAETAGATS